MFNEGHARSDGGTLVDVDLCDESIRLLRLAHAQAPEHAETAGLLALLLLTDALRAARTGPAGELIPLDEQDRSRWDRARIAEGQALLTGTLRRGAVGAFQVQAAIAALHDEAANFAVTDWRQILALYDLLLRMHDSPVVALNRVVAFAMVHGPAAALALLPALARDPGLARGHRLLAVRAHLHAMLGANAAARDYFLAAAAESVSLLVQCDTQREIDDRLRRFPHPRSLGRWGSIWRRQCRWPTGAGRLARASSCRRSPPCAACACVGMAGRTTRSAACRLAIRS